MKYNTFLIKFGELTTKGRNKSSFINSLVTQINTKTSKFNDTNITVSSDRIFVDFNENDYEEILEEVRHVFGIHSICLVRRCSLDIDEICENINELIKDEDKSEYKIMARRRYKQYNMNSDQINRYVAGKLFQRYPEANVNIRKPKLKITIEIRENESYIYFKEVPGLKGLPLGSSGKALGLMSGGIDSVVAMYFAMKRGVKINAITFTSPPYTSKKALDKVKDLAKIISEYNNETMKLYEVNFTEIQKFILDNCPERIYMTMQRRSMFRISENLANKFKHLALVTGESIGQVASQTFESMSCINQAVDMPIIRPLVTLDKSEIIDEAIRLNTYETSILPYEDSCTVFLPKNPATKPRLDKILEHENKIINELLELERKAIEEVIRHNIVFNDKSEELDDII